jgi:hypothetical protein
MYKLYCITIIISLKLAAAHAQLTLIKHIPLTATCITTDKTGVLYVALNNNSIYKLNNTGDSIGYFNAVRRGAVTQLDATNPLEVVAYYKDIPQITLLNNMMNLRGNIDLRPLNLFNTSAVSYSADGDIWVYDVLQAEFIKINDQQKKRVMSFNLLQQFADNIYPIYLCEQERNLFVVDSVQGILRFDQFGTYITTYHFNTKEVQYINNQLVFKQGDSLVVYNTNTLKEQSISLPIASDVLQVRTEQNRLYIRRKQGIDIYKFNLL